MLTIVHTSGPTMYNEMCQMITGTSYKILMEWQDKAILTVRIILTAASTLQNA